VRRPHQKVCRQPHEDFSPSKDLAEVGGRRRHTENHAFSALSAALTRAIEELNVKVDEIAAVVSLAGNDGGGGG